MLHPSARHLSTLFLLGLLASCGGEQEAEPAGERPAAEARGDDGAGSQPAGQPTDKPEGTGTVDIVRQAVAQERSRNAVESWRCGDLLVEAHHIDEQLELDTGARLLRLSPTASASGARYADEQGNVFWSKASDQALLELDGGRRSQCRPSEQASVWGEARRRGVSLRATGHEPGWYLEVRQGLSDPALRLVTGYGAEHIQYDRLETLPAPGKSWHSADGQVSITVTEAACTDAATGQRFPLSVSIDFADRSLTGCGRRL